VRAGTGVWFLSHNHQINQMACCFGITGPATSSSSSSATTRPSSSSRAPPAAREEPILEDSPYATSLAVAASMNLTAAQHKLIIDMATRVEQMAVHIKALHTAIVKYEQGIV